MPAPRRLLLPLLLLAFALLLHNLTQESLWRDEVDSIRFAAEIWTDLTEGDSIGDTASELANYLARPGWNGPLYFWALHPWLKLAGDSELALRLPSAWAALLAIALSYALGTRLINRPAGQLVAVLMIVNPYLNWYAGEGKMYALITALTLLSTYCLLRALGRNQKRYWLSYTLVTTLLFYTHILSPLLLPVQVCLALLLYPAVWRRVYAWLAAGALTLPYLPLLRWQWPLLSQPAETGFPFVPLPTMFQRMAEAFGRGIIGWPAAVPLALLLGAMLLGPLLFILTKNRPAELKRWRKLLGLVVWAILPVLELYLISLRRPLFTERYLIWTLPAWLLLTVWGLVTLRGLRRPGRWLALVWTAGLALVGLLGIGRQWSTPVRADFRGAADFVRENYQSGELILFQIPYLQTTFDYYAQDLAYPAAEGPYTNYGDPPETVNAHLCQLTANYRRVWLVLSEASMWDQRGLTAAWFAQHGRLLHQIQLNRVEVSQWELTACSLDNSAP